MLPILSFSLLATLPITLLGASPLPSAPSNSGQKFLLRGQRTAGQSQAYKRSNGDFNLDFAIAEFSRIRQKYPGVAGFASYQVNTTTAGSRSRVEQVISKVLAKRSGTRVGTVPLTDLIVDGTDLSYYGSITIGTPPQSLSVIFDTGVQQYFNPLSSSTYKQTLTPFDIVYGTGAVVGTVGRDTVSIANLTVPGQLFGVVNVCSQSFINSPTGGIFGLGFRSIAQIKSVTPVAALVAQGVLKQNLFAFYLTRKQVTGSLLTVGDVDPAHFSGPISYTPVTVQGYWQVAGNPVVVNGIDIGPAFPAAIDTGTTFIYAPKAIAAAVFAAIPGSGYDTIDSAEANLDIYTFPCNSTVIVALSFAGIAQPMNISPLDFNIGTAPTGNGQCIGAILGTDVQDAAGDNIMIVGDAFLKSWYSVYNYNGTVDGSAPAVGFAVSNP